MGHRQSRNQKSNRKQISLFSRPSRHQFCHGGVLRNKKLGRGRRPISCKEPLHVVFKANRYVLKEKSLRGQRSFLLVQKLIRKYALRFYVKVEQISVQGDHIHLLIRCPRRAQFHHFFRVTAGQISQVLSREGLLKQPSKSFFRDRAMTDTPLSTDVDKDCSQAKLWLYRPFSRVVRSWKALRTAKDYIQLNEKEALGLIKYQSQRLRGLSSRDWGVLWG